MGSHSKKSTGARREKVKSHEKILFHSWTDTLKRLD